MVKMLKFFSLVFINFTATIFLSSASLYAASKKITITGSTTVLPIAQRVAEAYMDIYEDVCVSVRGRGSGVGIAALIDGRADIADASFLYLGELIEFGLTKKMFTVPQDKRTEEYLEGKFG